MKINDIATAAQSLANYCYREGESADLDIIDGAVKVISNQVTMVRQDRLSAMLDAAIEDGTLQPEAMPR